MSIFCMDCLNDKFLGDGSMLCYSLLNFQNAQYEFGFYETHPTIVLFWEVFMELSEDDKKAFLCEYISSVLTDIALFFPHNGVALEEGADK